MERDVNVKCKKVSKVEAINLSPYTVYIKQVQEGAIIIPTNFRKKNSLKDIIVALEFCNPYIIISYLYQRFMLCL